jgi:hypothetical protein
LSAIVCENSVARDGAADDLGEIRGAPVGNRDVQSAYQSIEIHARIWIESTDII